MIVTHDAVANSLERITRNQVLNTIYFKRTYYVVDNTSSILTHRVFPDPLLASIVTNIHESTDQLQPIVSLMLSIARWISVKIGHLIKNMLTLLFLIVFIKLNMNILNERNSKVDYINYQSNIQFSIQENANSYLGKNKHTAIKNIRHLKSYCDPM